MEDNTAFIINRTFRRLLVPTMLGTVSIVFSMLIDVSLITYFVGANGLAISSLFVPLLILWGCVYEGLGMGASSMFAKCIGQGHVEKGKRIIAQSNTLVLCVVGCITLVGLLLSCFFTSHTFGISQDLFDDVIWYARIMFITTIPLVMNNYLLFQVRVDSAQNISGWSNGIQVVLNIVLDLVFMSWLDFGIKGAALAMLIASSIAFFVTSSHFMNSRSFLSLKCKLPDRSLIINLSRYAMNTVNDNITDFLLALFVNISVLVVFGLEIASVVYIINYIMMFTMYWGMGLAYSMAPILGVYYGERNNVAVEMVARKGLVYSVIIGVVLMILIMLFSRFIAVDVFNYEYPQHVEGCVEAIRIFSISLPFYMVSFIIISYCQQLERYKVASFMTYFSNLLLPMMCILVAMAMKRPFFIWWCFLFSNVIVLLCLFVYVWMKKKKEGLDSFLCLPLTSTKVSMYFLIRPDEQGKIMDYQDMVAMFLTSHNIESISIRHSVLAIEEIMTFSEATHQRKKGYVAIEIVICENSNVRFLVKLENDNVDVKNVSMKDLYICDDLLSLHVLRTLSSDFEYQRILSFNTIDMTIEPKKLL